MASRIEGAQVFADTVTFLGSGNPALGAAVVRDAQVASDAAIGAAKIVHQHKLRLSQKLATVVATETHMVHMCRFTGTVIALEVVCEVAPTGNATVVVDFKKSTALGAPASVLSAAITLNSSSVARTIQNASLGEAAAIVLIDNDILYIEVTATVGSGALPTGLCVVATINENGV
ncbi:MAG: hypothetical protein IMZ62_02585 [Chloroflexi bacterium]|nr:hypothetical protein [Chloroflexota bacterium]